MSIILKELSISLWIHGRENLTSGEFEIVFWLQEGKYDEALSIAKQQVENGAQVIDINMDEGTSIIDLDVNDLILVIIS